MTTSFGAPEINPHTFPYRLRWTQEIYDDVMARFDRLSHAMTDIVGPTGAVTYVSPDHVKILALHAALAGADVLPDKALIEYRLRPDANYMFEAVHEWRPVGEFDDDDPFIPQEEIDRRARELHEQMRQEVDPEVMAALQKKLADEYASDMEKKAKQGRRVSKEGES